MKLSHHFSKTHDDNFNYRTFFQFRMSSNNSPATKTDRRKSKRKSCIEIIASAKIVRDVDPDTTDPLKVMFFFICHVILFNVSG